MRYAIRVSLLLAAIASTALEAQPTPSPRCPAPRLAGLSPSVRAEVDRLTSSEPGARANGAAALAEMGGKAAPAIPWLFLAIDDLKGVVSLQYGRVTVAFVAGRALAEIGKPAVDCLLGKLADSHLTRKERGLAIRAAAIMRAPETLNAILSQAELVYPTGTEPQDGLASELITALVCFTPDVRVGDALLRLGTDGKKAFDADSGALIWFNSATGQKLPNWTEAAKWWAEHRPAALKSMDDDSWCPAPR